MNARTKRRIRDAKVRARSGTFVLLVASDVKPKWSLIECVHVRLVQFGRQGGAMVK